MAFGEKSQKDSRNHVCAIGSFHRLRDLLSLAVGRRCVVLPSVDRHGWSRAAADQSKAEALQRVASTTPQLKSLAAQSMALLSIRANKYSDAWKHATSDPASLAAATRSVQLTGEKIKLWLLVEARSAQAEDQLKRFVTLVIHADTSEADRQDASYFLGKLLKLLDGSDASCGVSKTTVDRARQVMEAQSSKASVSMFQTGWTEAEQWHSQLLELVAKCQSKSQTQATVDELSNDLIRQQKKTDEARQQQKQEKVRKTSWTETAIASFSRFAMWWRNRNAKHQADLNVPQHLDPSHRGQATMLKPPIGIGTSEKCVNMIREWIDIAMMFEITTLESKSGNKPIGSDVLNWQRRKRSLIVC